jgi:alanyl-tRNA synthetase
LKMADPKKEWTSTEIRDTFIKFFEEREHTFVHSSPVVPHNDPTLLFANAGMNQFKSIFLCTVDPNSDMAKLKRAVNSQKCIRAGGKHNDLDDVGKDNYHHTFFEMLGNWSFGDFFKKEAIKWSWELLTEVYGLDKSRLYVTYFEGNEKAGLEPDNEAKSIWAQYIDEDRILPGNMKDNFWEMGAVGPCGPCSEIHYDRIGGRDAKHLVNMDDPTVLEVWNLVFMQFERKGPETLVPLPACHVDTGMGLERISSVLMGAMSNYEIDLFQDIFKSIQEVTGAKPYENRMGDDDVDMKDTAYRVVADHIRMLSIAIADGQNPGSDGRAYVLRRVIRRAVRYGDEFLHAPPDFFGKLVPSVVKTLGSAFPSLVENQAQVERVLKEEEKLFRRTLKNGRRKFDNLVKKMEKNGENTFSSQEAARLFTTYGFPADLTRIMCEERGFKYDECAVEELLAAEKQKSKDAQAKKQAMQANAVKMAPDALAHLSETLGVPPTDDSFKYDVEDINAKILAIYKDGSFIEQATKEDGVVGLFLDRTSFYAEQGGQHYDQGDISKESLNFSVVNVQGFQGRVYHSGFLENDGKFAVGDTVDLNVNFQRRQPLMANHTCTHILNHALRNVVGGHVDQKGSLVLMDKLRFDFNNDKPLTSAELTQTQDFVSNIIDENLDVYTKVVPLEEAKTIYGVRCLFAETYPNPVRVVSVGVDVKDLLRNPDNKDWMKYSVEFCGGTHVAQAGQLCNFAILAEEALGAGVRRITAVTGDEAIQAYKCSEEIKLRLDAAKGLPVDKLPNALKVLRQELDDAVIPADAKKNYRQLLEKLGEEVLKAQKCKAAESSKAKEAFADDVIAELNETHSPYVVKFIDVNGKNALMTQAIKAITAVHPNVAVLLVSTDTTHAKANKHKAVFVAQVPESLVPQLSAKDWAAAAATVCGGKGGGKPTTAQGTGPKVGEYEAAIAEAAKLAESKFC